MKQIEPAMIFEDLLSTFVPLGQFTPQGMRILLRAQLHIYEPFWAKYYNQNGKGSTVKEWWGK